MLNIHIRLVDEYPLAEYANVLPNVIVADIAVLLFFIFEPHFDQ